MESRRLDLFHLTNLEVFKNLRQGLFSSDLPAQLTDLIITIHEVTSSNSPMHNYALELLSSFGKVEIVPEHLIDAVVAVSGSSPAYIFMFIEAMADGAVAEGMPRPQAYQFAAQAVLGSAKMVLETGKHPGELKDMVCSPAGTTIEAVRVLEKFGLRSAVIEAEKVCADMSRNM